MSGIYAVRRGRNVGIFQTWKECKQQIHQFPGAQYKKFKTVYEAEAFIRDGPGKKSDDSQPSSSKQSITSAVQEAKMQSEPGFEVVYTDGCCINNGSNNPRGGIGVYWGPDHEWNVSESLPDGRQTNNRAEILACEKAIKQAHRSGINKLEIRTDSNFTIRCITEWLPSWKKNGWKKSGGEPVINEEELRSLDDAVNGYKSDGNVVKFVHVRGHVGVEGNEAADRLAVNGAKKVK